jgi:hypothetical protein
VPPPLAVVTEIETTDGVTRDAIALVFMPLPPISTSVRLEEHVPVVERKRAWVRLSAHAFRVPVVELVAAVAIDPASAAPAINAPITLTCFIDKIMPEIPESFLL